MAERNPEVAEEPLPHSIRITAAGNTRRQKLIAEFFATTSFDTEMSEKDAMRLTEAGSDDDD